MAHHPTTRAERRNARRVTIKACLGKARFLHLFTRHCTCYPLGWRYSKSEPQCDIHDRPLGSMTPRNVGRFAKTRPYDWVNSMEPEWFLGGKLRRDYRAGGGRRARTGDYGGGLHGAGKFCLRTALAEWSPVSFGEQTVADPADQFDLGCSGELVQAPPQT